MTHPFKHHPRQNFTPQQRARIFAENDGRCYRCERRLGPSDTWEIEHLIALENGGTNDPQNLDVICGWCHKVKTAQDHGKAAKSRDTYTAHVVPTKHRRDKRRGFRGHRKFNGEIVWK